MDERGRCLTKEVLVRLAVRYILIASLKFMLDVTILCSQGNLEDCLDQVY